MNDMETTGFLRRTILLTAAAMPMMGSKVLAATPNQGASTVYFAKDINAENFLAIYDRLKKDGNLPDDGRLTGIKLHGDDVDTNRTMWEALLNHIPNSKFVECNYARKYSGDYCSRRRQESPRYLGSQKRIHGNFYQRRKRIKVPLRADRLIEGIRLCCSDGKFPNSEFCGIFRCL